MVEDKPILYCQGSPTENHSTSASGKVGSVCEASSEYVTAIYSYFPHHSDEIKLRTGHKIKILSKDCRHSGAEGWWVGQEPKTGHVGVFPSGYVSNSEDTVNITSAGISKTKSNSSDLVRQTDIICEIGNNTDTSTTVEAKEEISSNLKSSYSDIVLRHGHVRTIPTTELVQQQFIGSGAFGKVYRGRWHDQDIALKVFDLATNQVDNEALHLCRLSHRNIVKFYGICRLDNSNFPALVMEYAYGGSLNMVLNQRPSLGPLVLLDWALQIASGMAYLHTDAKICHRDLKSSNILIREPIQKPFSINELQKCTLLITDFGMACRSSQLAPQQSKLGTVAYAAPEVCRQEGFSFKSDIWSYGVVLWELLTLDIPFRAMEQPRLLFIIAMYNYTLYIPPGVPDLFVQLFKVIVRSIFRRWGSNGNPYSTHHDHINPKILSNNLQGKDHKRSISSPQCISNNRPQFNINANNSSDLNGSVFDDNQSVPRGISSRIGCSQGGIPLISPPTDMKHVVHVDSDWFTGQGLCESTMRLFPCATFTNPSIGSNSDQYCDISSCSCNPQIRTFMNTKSDSSMADKSTLKSPRTYSSGNTVIDSRIRERRYGDLQINLQRNMNRLPRKSNFIRKFENKNNLDFLQKSSYHSVGFSNFFTPINSCCYEANSDFNCNEHSHSRYYNSRAVQPRTGHRVGDNNSPTSTERRRSASGR
ncbi:Mitogen-activated protein kinase kinase kinase 9 [Schistosoma japonicum]|uniref:mitogen-activated protein kinase kinase kinase n=1 Tax=Schistosoma japonicum TaxID=6182 RepID=A0A4Z2CTJ3_SCHJA|nr:Mitogen-activated protein kinase kinase kinase 9 [Schistosoma japonicum]